MADAKVTALSALTTFSGDESFYVVEDDDGTPVSRQVTIENLVAGLAPYLPGAVLAMKHYEPGADGNIGSSTSSTFADVDATNAVVTFTVPPSGKVFVEASALCRNDTQAGACKLNLREASSDLAGTDMRMSVQASTTNQNEERGFYCAYITGLTPGASKTYKLGIAREGSTGTAQLRGGPVLGPLVMKVIAAP